MAKDSKIQWTDHTFNVWWGCHRLSPGCDNCYAADISKVYFGDLWASGRHRFLSSTYWEQPYRWNRQAARSGQKARVFCSSMADVFEEVSKDHPDHVAMSQARSRLFQVIRDTQHLNWLLLTKRPSACRRILPADWGSGYPNVWLGTTVEDQPRASRIKHLVRVPAIVHFLSVEPLLGPVQLELDDVEWVIVGGESGPRQRTRRMDPVWVKDILRACRQRRVPVFVKQLGGHLSEEMTGRFGHGGDFVDWPKWMQVRRFPKTVIVK